jgi:hypothetical protein
VVEVAVVGWQLLRLLIKVDCESDRVKLCRWKFSNLDLTFDEIVRELMKLADQGPSQFKQDKADLLREFREHGVGGTAIPILTKARHRLGKLYNLGRSELQL